MLNALLVANVGVDAVQQGKDGLFGGNLQPGMGHQRQQAHGFQRHGFAAGIRAGNDHHPPVAAQFQVKGNYRLRQQRMAGGGKPQGGGVFILTRQRIWDGWDGGDGRGYGPLGGGVAAFSQRQIQPRQQIQSQQQIGAALPHLRGQGAQNPLLLPLLGQPGLPPLIARFNGRQRLDKDRRPAVGNIVDNAGGLGLKVGFNQQHQAVVALGNNRLLHHRPLLITAQAALHYRVQLLIGVPGRAAQLPQLGTGVIQQFSRGTDRVPDSGFQGAQIGQVGGDVGQQGQVGPAAQAAAVMADGISQLTDFVQLGAAQQSAQSGPLGIFPQVRPGAKLQGWAGGGGIHKTAALGGFLLPADNFPVVGGRRQSQSILPPPVSADIPGQLPADGVKLQQGQSRIAAVKRAVSRRRLR